MKVDRFTETLSNLTRIQEIDYTLNRKNYINNRMYDTLTGITLATKKKKQNIEYKIDRTISIIQETFLYIYLNKNIGEDRKHRRKIIRRGNKIIRLILLSTLIMFLYKSYQTIEIIDLERQVETQREKNIELTKLLSILKSESIEAQINIERKGLIQVKAGLYEPRPDQIIEVNTKPNEQDRINNKKGLFSRWKKTKYKATDYQKQPLKTKKQPLKNQKEH